MSSGPKNLLIVDDDEDTRIHAAQSLRLAGLRVIEANSALDGMRLAQSERPDVILLGAPHLADGSGTIGFDGYDCCRQLRALPLFERIPIILLIDWDDSSSIEMAYASGGSDFMRKPLNPSILAHRIRHAHESNRALAEVERQRARLSRAQRIARLGNWYWHPAQDRLEITPEFRSMLGLSQESRYEKIEDLLTLIDDGDRARIRTAIADAGQRGTPYSLSYRIRHASNGLLTVHEQIEVVRTADDAIDSIESTVQDITERIESQERIHQLARYDSLTGMANRAQFSAAVQPLLSATLSRGRLSAVMQINLDRFVRINETFGHAAGDRVLQEIAARVMRSVRVSDPAAGPLAARRSDLYARMSGDEFAVYVADLKSAEDATAIAHRLLHAISQPTEIDSQPFSVSACIGIALSDGTGVDTQALLRNAESALRQAKQMRSGSVVIYSGERDDATRASMSLETELRQALELGQFVVYYQPRVDVAQGRLVGAEALVRWVHPQRGIIMPGAFISIAESMGLIEALTHWVLENICQQQSDWRAAGLPVVPVSVNFSTHSFVGAGPSESILHTLAEHGLQTDAIEVEITESVMMQDIDQAARALDELRSMGIELAIDDFGTGFSSLNYLKRLPLSILKIDRSFVKDVLIDAHDGAIATAIIALGAAIGLRVVAEGVESIEQARFLLDRGCSLMQGYLFARPMPAEEFARTLVEGPAIPQTLLDYAQSIDPSRYFDHGRAPDAARAIDHARTLDALRAEPRGAVSATTD